MADSRFGKLGKGHGKILGLTFAVGLIFMLIGGIGLAAASGVKQPFAGVCVQNCNSPALAAQNSIGCTCASQTMSSVPVNQGDVIVIYASSNSGSAALSTCTFNGVACSVRAAYPSASGPALWEDYFVASSTGIYPLVATITASQSWILTELTVRGANTVTPFDTGTSTSSNFFTSTCTACSQQLTTTYPDDLVISGLIGVGTYSSVPAQFTLATNYDLSGVTAATFATEIISATQNQAITWPGLSSGAYGVVIEGIQGAPTTSTSTSTVTGLTSVTLASQFDSVPVGDSLVMTVTPTYSTGATVSGTPGTYAINGVQSGSFVTAANGIATLDIPFPSLSPPTYVVTATIGGVTSNAITVTAKAATTTSTTSTITISTSTTSASSTTVMTITTSTTTSTGLSSLISVLDSWTLIAIGLVLAVPTGFMLLSKTA